MNGAASYQSGRRFEWRVRDAFLAADWFVSRSPGSKSPVDHVTVRANGRYYPEVWFVQCQRQPVMGRAKWNALYDAATAVNASPILATLDGRLLRFYRLTEKKDGIRRPQPMEEVAL